MSAAISIGGVAGLPFIPWFNDRYGRKACIVFGSIIMTIGVILQTAAVNSMYTSVNAEGQISANHHI